MTAPEGMSPEERSAAAEELRLVFGLGGDEGGENGKLWEVGRPADWPREEAEPNEWSWADPETGEAIALYDPRLPKWWTNLRDEVWRVGGRFTQTLGPLLALAAAAVPPAFQLPPKPARAPITLFVIALGDAGSGKTTGWSLAYDAIDPFREIFEMDMVGVAPASGVGVIGVFINQADPKRPLRENRRAVLKFDEAAVMTAWNNRKGTEDMFAMLRSAWSGDTLGTSGGKRETTRFVPAGSYSLSFVVGAQTGLDLQMFADEITGTRQRFLCVPLTDRQEAAHRSTVSVEEVLKEASEAGKPMGLRSLGWEPPELKKEEAEEGSPQWTSPGEERVYISVHTAVNKEITLTHLAVQNLADVAKGAASPNEELLNRTVRRDEWKRVSVGEVGEHTNQLRLRLAAVASALRDPKGMSNGEGEVSEGDWWLAGVVLWMSNRAFADYQRRRKEAAAEKRRERHEAAADEAAAREEGRADAEEIRVEESLERMVNSSLERLAAHNGDGLSAGDLWRATSSRDRLRVDRHTFEGELATREDVVEIGKNRQGGALYFHRSP